MSTSTPSPGIPMPPRSQEDRIREVIAEAIDRWPAGRISAQSNEVLHAIREAVGERPELLDALCPRGVIRYSLIRPLVESALNLAQRIGRKGAPLSADVAAAYSGVMYVLGPIAQAEREHVAGYCRECEKPLLDMPPEWTRSGVCSRACWGHLHMEAA